MAVGQSIWDTGENESSNLAPAFMPFRAAAPAKSSVGMFHRAGTSEHQRKSGAGMVTEWVRDSPQADWKLTSYERNSKLVITGLRQLTKSK